jgi:DNA mismatch repair ATPase MutL
LSLSAVDEMTLREHQPLFEQNGFSFTEHPSSGHLQLSAVPFSKATTFGVEDVHELVWFWPAVLLR